MPYDAEERWVCRPDLATDPCREDLSILEVESTRDSVVIDPLPAASPAVACFYVYPTTSTDSTPNADWTDSGEESLISKVQAGPYSEVCDVWSPLYRQVSVLGLLGGTGDDQLAYTDVSDAFDVFLNGIGGRDFLLIGHSQGSRHLIRLIQERIDGEDLSERLVAAHLFGGQLEVPVGEVVGGSFAEIPLCETSTQTGCAVHWVTYRSLPAFGGAVYGWTPTAGREIACTDPADLFDSSELAPSLPRNVPLLYSQTIGGVPRVFQDAPQPHQATTFYSPAGVVSGTCRTTGQVRRLDVDFSFEHDDARSRNLGGELILPGWGLHLYDMAIASQDLVELAGRQIDAH